MKVDVVAVTIWGVRGGVATTLCQGKSLPRAVVHSFSSCQPPGLGPTPRAACFCPAVSASSVLSLALIAESESETESLSTWCNF